MEKRKYPNSETERYLDHLFKQMNAAFPNACITLLPRDHYTDRGHLSDSFDEHILEAAILSKANLIITNDSELIKNINNHSINDIKSKNVDNFLNELPYNKQPIVLNSLAEISERSGQRGPHLTIEDLLFQLRRSGCATFVDAAFTLLQNL